MSKASSNICTRTRVNTLSAGNPDQDDTHKELHEIKEMIKGISDKLKCIDKLEKEIKDIKKIFHKLEVMENDISSLKQSVEFLANKYDDIVKESNIQRQKLKELHKVHTTNSTTDDLLTKVVNIEAYQRNRNIEIHGIEEKPNENCVVLIQQVAAELRVEISKDDIDIAHRVKSRKQPNSSYVIAQFKSRSRRDLLAKSKHLVITNNNIPGTKVGQKIYINDNLTTYHRALLGKTKALARQNNFKFAWYKNGKIMVRKNENEKIIIINKCEDLLLITNNVSDATDRPTC